MNNQSSLECDRESKKRDLEFFMENLKENNFENAISNSITILNLEIQNEFLKFIERQVEDDYDGQGYHLDTSSQEEKLLALNEMNIVYMYKVFEINIKSLIGFSYGVNLKDLYKWRQIGKFFKSKNIYLSNLIGYQEIDELRRVNNSIKHHSTQYIDQDIRNIKEFSEIEFFKHNYLFEFNERVKYFPYKFLDCLAQEISKNLYEFNNERLHEIADDCKKRDDKTILKLIEYLKPKKN